MPQIKITLNGEQKILAKNIAISQLISDLELDVKKIAIERNLEIIDPATFSATIINDGDVVEIVHFIGGG